MIAPLLAAALAAGAPPPAPAPGCAAAPPALRSHCEALAARPRLPLPTEEERRVLASVYARPELRRARAEPAGLRRMLAGLWARILDRLGSAEAERYASVGRAAFVAAALAATVAGLAAARRRRRRAAPGSPRAAGIDRSPLPASDRSAALAEEALARGDLRSAVRHAFLSALAALESAARLPRDRTLTNRELAARLHAMAAPLAAPFAALARIFDGAVYGGLPVGEPEARESLELARRIRAGSGA